MVLTLFKIKPQTESLVTGIGIVINYKVHMEQYRTIQFLRDANIKVCYLQADLASDARNIARRLENISMIKNISLLDFDQWMSEQANTNDKKVIYTLLNNHSSMTEHLRTKFFAYLNDLDAIDKQVIVYGTMVKYLFGKGMFDNPGLGRPVYEFMEQSSMFIVDYYNDNIIKRVYHTLTMDICETRMRNLIDMGNNDDLVRAEHDLDCGRFPFMD